jgi:hypothetical protein
MRAKHTVGHRRRQSTSQQQSRPSYACAPTRTWKLTLLSASVALEPCAGAGDGGAEVCGEPDGVWCLGEPAAPCAEGASAACAAAANGDAAAACAATPGWANGDRTGLRASGLSGAGRPDVEAGVAAAAPAAAPLAPGGRESPNGVLPLPDAACPPLRGPEPSRMMEAHDRAPPAPLGVGRGSAVIERLLPVTAACDPGLRADAGRRFRRP